MKNLCLSFTLLLLISSCRSSGVPAYHADTKAIDSTSLILTLDSSSGLSPDEFRKAVLTEAAHAAIDRGATYLRVDTLSFDDQVLWSGMLDVRMTRPDENAGAALQPVPAVERPGDTGLTRTHRRTGVARITIAKDALSGEHVFDAAKLLDDLREGRIPPP